METKKEALTLQRKKTTLNKAKIKKTIKNTLCRPDPVFWPTTSEDEASKLKEMLSKYKVEIPELKKPHWKELKSIPKDQRPKQPKIQRVDGLIFGISETTESVKNQQCSALIIESSVNPRAIVQPLLEACISSQTPILCLDGLRTIASLYFGIPTSCLGVKKDFLQELTDCIKEIAKSHQMPHKLKKPNEEINNQFVESKIDKEESIIENMKAVTSFSYLYRSSKKERVFNPSLEKTLVKKSFAGQDFIEFSAKPEQKTASRKEYMNMILKRVTNNPNRKRKTSS